MVTTESEVKDVQAEEEVVVEKQGPMAELMEGSEKPPQLDDVVEGPVIALGRARVFVDLHPFGTGIIYGREYLSARETLKNVNLGDTITAKVVGTDNADGYIELSLREARQALIWNEAEVAMQKKTSFELAITDANKGGLIINWNGIQGFLPASQLSPAHYPRVPDGDKDKIFSELKKMIGTKLEVMVITASPKEAKLIFSEKGAGTSERANLVEKYHVGDVLEGVVTGATEFGVFVKLEEGLEGLVHISEIAWGHVSDAHDFARLGDKVNVKIIGIDGDKISLSMKQLTKDPWEEIEKKYKVGSLIKTKITRLAQFGAFVQLEDDITGLIHNSEISGNPEDPAKVLEVGQAVEARVIEINKDEKRIGLSLLAEGEAPTEKHKKARKEAVKEEAPAQAASDDAVVEEKADKVEKVEKVEKKPKKAAKAKKKVE